MVTKILRQVAKEFYDNGYDIEILEKHHNQKIDAPSGTAKLLYEVMEDEIKETTPVYDRSALHEKERNKKLVFKHFVVEQFLVNMKLCLQD